jgi:hypothetical protein
MQVYFAKRLVAIGDRLSNIMASTTIQEAALSKEEKAIIKERLFGLAKEAEAIELKETSELARIIAGELDSKSGAELFERFAGLEELFNIQIKNVQFFFVERGRAHFYNKTDHAGPECRDKFPRANVELIEAGNCLALARFTASVFHLTRALEYGLRAVASGLGLPDPTKGPDRNWGAVLKTIKGRIDSNNMKLKADPIWQGDREFYEKAYAFLEAVRNPIRNATIHVEADCDEQSAADVLNACSAFMRHIAVKLVE